VADCADGFFVIVCAGFCPPPAEGDVVFNINLLISPFIHFGYVQTSHVITISAVYSNKLYSWSNYMTKLAV